MEQTMPSFFKNSFDAYLKTTGVAVALNEVDIV